MMKSFAISLMLVSVSLCSPACAQKGTTPEARKASATMRPAATSTTKAADKPDEAETPASKKNEAIADKSQRVSSSRASSKPALTPEQEKQVKSMQRQLLKSFSAAELTEEQKQQADEMFAKVLKSVIAKRSDVQLSDELVKKQIAALKDAKNTGKSMKEQTTDAFTSAGFTEEQIKVFKSTESALAKAKRDFAKLLTEEQLACLPEAVQNQVSKR